MTTIAISLPDDLAAEAREAGLLAPEALRALLEEKLRREAVQVLIQTTEPLRRNWPPAMTEAGFQKLVQEALDNARARK